MIDSKTIASAISNTIMYYSESGGESANAVLQLSTTWGQPLTGFARADDPRFSRLKEIVSPSHLLPCDILAGAKTVICFYVPFSDDIIQTNEAGIDASREWALCYIICNKLIKFISEELASLFGAAGYHCGLVPATHNFDEKRLLSDWSHRHAAWVAGLGSFGENNMLITEKGCCGRYGTLVTDWQAAEQDYPAAEQREHCLARRGKSCRLCHKKCPAGAYKDGFFDRHACYSRCLHNAALHNELGFADVCGKCLCGLPCSSRSP
jgi:epoxyqueuosine reductase QueG